MPTIHHRWKVLPHGPPVEMEDGLLTVEGDIPMPLGHFPRRMTVARLADGGTVVFSAMALGEVAMARLEALGRPAFMVVPSGFHRLDAPAWKQRYPQLRVIAPAGARRRVEQVVPVDSIGDILGDPEVRFVTVAGTGEQESALIVARPGGTTLVVNDVLGNVRHPRGIGARIMARLSGYGGKEPTVPRTIGWFIVKDRPALARQFREWARLPNLARIIMSHGEPVTTDPAGLLDRLAGELD